MVGPVSESERAAFRRVLKVGVTLLVGVSTGLVAVQTDATLPQVGGATLVGLIVGAGLSWYVVPSRSPLAARRARPDPENPFRNDGSGEGTDENDGGDGGTRGAGTRGAGNRDDSP